MVIAQTSGCGSWWLINYDSETIPDGCPKKVA